MIAINKEEFTDKNGREWEYFLDEGYFHLWCVRYKHDRKFNSVTSFHFDTKEEALDFCNLLERAR